MKGPQLMTTVLSGINSHKLNERKIKETFWS